MRAVGLSNIRRSHKGLDTAAERRRQRQQTLKDTIRKGSISDTGVAPEAAVALPSSTDATNTPDMPTVAPDAENGNFHRLHRMYFMLFS